MQTGSRFWVAAAIPDLVLVLAVGRLVENEIKVFKCSIKIRMFAKSKKIV